MSRYIIVKFLRIKIRFVDWEGDVRLEMLGLEFYDKILIGEKNWYIFDILVYN